LGKEAPEEQLVETALRNWNATHIWLIQSQKWHGVNLDGMIRPGHVKKILQNCAYQVRANQMGGCNLHAELAAVDNMELKKADNARLSHRGAAPWLKLIGKPWHNMLAKQLEKLVKYFDEKPDSHELSL
jgi:hypothetical protein